LPPPLRHHGHIRIVTPLLCRLPIATAAIRHYVSMPKHYFHASAAAATLACQLDITMLLPPPRRLLFRCHAMISDADAMLLLLMIRFSPCVMLLSLIFIRHFSTLRLSLIQRAAA